MFQYTEKWELNISSMWWTQKLAKIFDALLLFLL